MDEWMLLLVVRIIVERMTDFVQAAIYTLISIAIRRLGREYSLLGPRAVLAIFITSDVIATLVQITGAALIGSAESNGKDPTTANDILLGGLAFQVFSFLVFIVLFLTFVWRSRAASSAQFKQFAAATMVATIAVYVRTVFRLAETAQGLLQYLSTHEAFFGALEFAPIVIAVYVFIWWHPGRFLGRKSQAKSIQAEAVNLSERK